MSRNSVIRAAAYFAVASAIVAVPAFADFTYEQTAKITGGSMVRMLKMVPGGGKALEPQVSTHLVKGNRMATINARSVSVIDLDKETMMEIDLEKNTYAIITFADFKLAMDAMQKKMAQQMKQGEANIEMTFDVKETGVTKNIGGFNAREVQLLITMAIKDPKHPEQVTNMKMDNDMWLAPKVAGYDEVRQFQMRMAEKLGYDQQSMSMGRMTAMQPGMGKGMAKLAAEASKLEGIPVLTITRMNGVGMGGDVDMNSGPTPTAGEVTQQEAGNQAGNAVGGALGGAAGAVLGGFGRFGRKSKAPPKEEAPAPEAKPAPLAAKPASPAGSGTLMEMTSEMTSFSAGPVDTSKFTPPAGAKEVEHSMKKALREASK